MGLGDQLIVKDAEVHGIWTCLQGNLKYIFVCRYYDLSNVNTCKTKKVPINMINTVYALSCLSSGVLCTDQFQNTA